MSELQIEYNSDICLLYLVPQSLSHLIVHAVFSTKDRRPFLRSEEIRTETYAFMAGILKKFVSF